MLFISLQKPKWLTTHTAVCIAQHRKQLLKNPNQTEGAPYIFKGY